MILELQNHVFTQKLSKILDRCSDLMAFDGSEEYKYIMWLEFEYLGDNGTKQVLEEVMMNVFTELTPGGGESILLQ